MTEQELRDPKRTPSRAGVLRAMEKIAHILPPTPLLPLEVDGRTLWCKAEMLQPIGAFKIRGAWHRLSDLTEEERQRGVVAVGIHDRDDERAGFVGGKLGLRRPAHFHRWYDTPVYQRDDLLPGMTFDGPAIIEQKDTTTVVEPDMHVVVDSHSNLLVKVK